MPVSTSVFAQAEQEVYYAYLEWPLWLVLRRRHLERAMQLAAGIEPPNKKETAHEQPDDR